MKTTLRRTLITICTVAILAAGFSSAQVPLPCSTFDNNLNGWTTEFATAAATGGVADLQDDQGPSYFVAPASYHGNWLALTGNCGGELCFDVDIIDDGLTTSNPVSVGFSITDGSGGHRATFSHTPVVEGTGWHHFCAPIGPLVAGNLPNNGQGTWAMNSGMNLDWVTLLQNVQTLKFSVDFGGSGAQTEHFKIDNICFHANPCATADFQVGRACAGQPPPFTNLSTGATSSLWTLPGATPATSTATVPAVVYPTAGTYQATLCINGGTAAPLCVTKPVTINPLPPVPVITGPPSSCYRPAMYCVTPTAGVTYSWSIIPALAGTLTPVTGSCTNINWSSTTGGVVMVTATNQYGCTSRARIEVPGCDTHNGCCLACPKSFNVVSWSLPYISGTHVFRPVISTSSPIKRLTIDIISASVSGFTPASCGTPRNLAPTITAVQPAFPAIALTNAQPVPSSTEAIWYTSTSVPAFTNVTFPVSVTLPTRPPNCNDTLRFCVKYTITDVDCRTCEIIECYELRREANPTPGTDTPDVR